MVYIYLLSYLLVSCLYKYRSNSTETPARLQRVTVHRADFQHKHRISDVRTEYDRPISHVLGRCLKSAQHPEDDIQGTLVRSQGKVSLICTWQIEDIKQALILPLVALIFESKAFE